MFGITGILYNPEKMTADEAGTWTVLNNPKFAKQITIKDNVRDSYFAAVGALQRDKLMDLNSGLRRITQSSSRIL